MKVKTSITLTDTLLTQIDEFCGGPGHRSSFVEAAVKKQLAKMARQRREARDLAILDENAESLNSESEDVLCW